MTLDERRIERAKLAMKKLDDELAADPENIFGSSYDALSRATVSAYLGNDSVVVPKQRVVESQTVTLKSKDGGSTIECNERTARALIASGKYVSAAARGGDGPRQ
jgi:hypothetical protein